MELRQLVGLGTGPHSVTVRKTVHVAAPVEEVFRYWSRYGGWR
jgi:hypothetical protein